MIEVYLVLATIIKVPQLERIVKAFLFLVKFLMNVSSSGADLLCLIYERAWYMKDKLIALVFVIFSIF